MYISTKLVGTPEYSVHLSGLPEKTGLDKPIRLVTAVTGQPLVLIANPPTATAISLSGKRINTAHLDRHAPFHRLLSYVNVPVCMYRDMYHVHFKNRSSPRFFFQSCYCWLVVAVLGKHQRHLLLFPRCPSKREKRKI